jgi:ferrochelatase
MRFSEPSIEHALRALVGRGVGDVAAIVLSPQFSPLLMGGYGRAIDEARARIGDEAPRVAVAGPWHDEPAFVGALADRLVEGRASLEGDGRGPVRILLTAHSVPRRIAESEPDYIAQLRGTAENVAARAGLDTRDWAFCWQSAGHEPGEWMTPDLADVMAEVARSGVRSIVVAPVQFLGDHLETLYDIDIAARAQAHAAGLGFARIRALDTDEGLIAALASAARRTLGPVAVG